MALLDLIIINLSAVMAFLLREHFGDLVIKQAPSFYLLKYLLVLLLLNLTYPFIFWLLGLYDRRQKRALLEEFILIFGVFSTSLAVLIIFLFLGRLWWMSRIVLFTFWGGAIILLCLSRLMLKNHSHSRLKWSINLTELRQDMLEKKNRLQNNLNTLLSIIIVNFNNREQLKACLAAIRAADIKQLIEVVVVDNASKDNPGELTKETKLIVNKSNLGYTKAVNQGIKAAKGEFILILNPDVSVIPGSIEAMLDYMLSQPKVGLVGAKLLNIDGTLQYSVRRFLDLRTYLYRFTPLRGLMQGSAIERYYLMQDWDHNDNRLVDWVLGGCMMVRKKALGQVGLMDECFFMYFDDVDWCFEMWNKGWQVAYVAEAAMFHQHMRTSANKLFNRATREHLKSLVSFILKRGFRLPRNCPSGLE